MSAAMVWLLIASGGGMSQGTPAVIHTYYDGLRCTEDAKALKKALSYVQFTCLAVSADERERFHR